MNRRSFIKTAGASAGAFAIGRGVELSAATGNAESASAQSTRGTRNDITVDVAVVGGGVMGNWTALSLREMGLSVVLIDQYSPGNSKSSSKGEIRGMRLTYGDNEHEMLWARDACEQWKIRQSEFGTDMFYQCGALSFRREWTARNTAERALFDKHEVPYEVIPYADLVRRWPQAPPPSEEYFGFYHPWGGVLSPRDANLAVATSFKSKGGRVILGGNSKSSSKGEIRGMRLTYGDNEHEMLWARDACEQWKIRQSEFGTDMFYQCGALSFRREWTARNTAERALFDKHEVPYEVIPYADLVRRWPQAPPPSEEYFGFYHPWGGVLSPRDANLAVATSFKSKGGRVILGKAMPGARAGGKLETVTLSSGETVSAGSFVFAVGAWLPKVFPVLMKDKLSVRKAGYYMFGTPPGDTRFSVPNLPNTGLGLPSINGAGFGLLINPTYPVDPDSFEHLPDADEQAAARQTVAARFPALKDQPIIAAWTCQTENSVDGQCIFDLHPEMNNVWLVGGGSWHAFKIGPVIGNYVAHRVIGEEKGLPEANLSGAELTAIFKLKPETFA